MIRGAPCVIRNTVMARKLIRVWVPKRNKMRWGPLSRRMLFTWLMLAGFILLFTPQKITSKFQFAFARIFRWPLSIGRNISLSASTQQSPANTLNHRESQYQNHIANLEELLNQERKKFKRLSGLRDRLGLEGAKLMQADVITASIGGYSELIINRGENDFLAKGQFVLGDNGIVGRISEVASWTAKVRLISNPMSQIPVKIAELNVCRVMQGSGNKSAKIPLLSTKTKLKTGNYVYADKQPGFLDSPMVVGKVAKCKTDDENPSLWDITVEPVCNIEKLNYVHVIIMNPKE